MAQKNVVRGFGILAGEPGAHLELKLRRGLQAAPDEPVLKRRNGIFGNQPRRIISESFLKQCKKNY